MLCPLWPLCGSSWYTHGTYSLVSGRQERRNVPLTTCSKHTHSAYKILKGVYRSTVHFSRYGFHVWGQLGRSKNKPFILLIYFEYLDNIKSIKGEQGWISPTWLWGLWAVWQLFGFGACSLVQIWKDIKKDRRYILTLFTVFGAPAAKGSFHPYNQKANFTTHPQWYRAMQIVSHLLATITHLFWRLFTSSVLQHKKQFFINGHQLACHCATPCCRMTSKCTLKCPPWYKRGELNFVCGS